MIRKYRVGEIPDTMFKVASRKKQPIRSIWYQPYEENWVYDFISGAEIGSRDVYEEDIPTEVNTGVLDHKGNPIIKYFERNPIGFHAKFEE